MKSDKPGVKISRSRKALIVLGSFIAIVVSATLGAIPANAATVIMNPNTSVGYGQGVAIYASWGDLGPYKVNFQCNIAGCANYVTNSTYVYNLEHFSSAIYNCAGQSSLSTITIWEYSGASASANTRTTWRPGC
jgi:hypothetical protein